METKFKIGEEVWTIREGSPVKKMVKNIMLMGGLNPETRKYERSLGTTMYLLDGEEVNNWLSWDVECTLFKSKLECLLDFIRYPDKERVLNKISYKKRHYANFQLYLAITKNKIT